MNKDFKKLFDEIEAIYKNCSREELLNATIVSVMFIFYNGYTQEDILNFSKYVMKGEVEMTEERVYLDLNKKYNCDVNLCLEDILSLNVCLDRIHKEMKLEYGCDFFTFTIKDIISRWEKTIGKKVEDCK